MIQREREIQAQEAAQRAQEATTARQQQEAKDLATFNTNKAFLEGLKVPGYLQSIIREEGLQNACVAWREDGLVSEKGVQLTGIALVYVVSFWPGHAGELGYGPEDWGIRSEPSTTRVRGVEILGNAEREVVVARYHTNSGFFGRSKDGYPLNLNYDSGPRSGGISLEEMWHKIVLSQDDLADPDKTMQLVSGIYLDIPEPSVIFSDSNLGTGYGGALKALVENIEQKAAEKRARAALKTPVAAPEPPPQPPKKGLWEHLLRG